MSSRNSSPEPNPTRYLEFQPPPRLASHVECFWTLTVNEEQPSYAVFPDACIDLIFSGSQTLQVVGTMTRIHHFRLPAGHRLCGVRFRPAMYSAFVRTPATLLTDQSFSLRDVWGTAADRLLQQLSESTGTQERIALMASQLTAGAALSPVQQACSWAARHDGLVALDDLARYAGLSQRQFRRLCLEQTGLTPKRLCRTLRFRRALSRLAVHRGDWTHLALDCGYYDQAHFINEFREFSGLAPGEYLASRRG